MTLRICHKQPEFERLTEGKVAAGSFSGRSAHSATQEYQEARAPRRVVVAEACTVELRTFIFGFRANQWLNRLERVGWGRKHR